jgi:hypothetical protein
MTKQDLHRLVDALPDASVAAAAQLLQQARDPRMAEMYLLPTDDEPYTEEQRAEDIQAMHKPGIPRRRFGKRPF